MIIYQTDPLFAWNRLDDSADLKSIKRFFEQLPDGTLLEALQQWRGKGRNDYPIRVLWFCALLQPLLRHPTMNLTLEELRRNMDLRRLGAMEHAEQVPKAWNMSRFLKVLGEDPFRTMLHGVFDTMVRRLGEAVPTLGEQAAGDATHVSARPSRGTPPQPAVPQPDGGRKEYVDEHGQTVRAFEWFGYKLHLLCDSRHEVALAYTVTPASTHDSQPMPELLQHIGTNLPARRVKSLAYDKACDDEAIHQALEKAHIHPVIQVRSLWKGETEQAVEGAGIGNVVHDEAGTLFCYDMVSDPPVRHRMAYIGHEPSRGTLKYRCPAEHESWRCPCSGRCNAGKRYGMTVRLKQDLDLRRFPSIPRATKQFERLYKGRTACERIHARLKVFWGVDDGNVAGGANFLASVGLVMVVHIGLATLLAGAQRREVGRLGQTKLSPIAKALMRS